MKVVDLSVAAIKAALWNPNRMDAGMRARLKASIERFGVLAPLIVRQTGRMKYETVGGAHRLSVIRELGIESVPCVVVPADDPTARLLAQALNHIAGDDDPGIRSEALRVVLSKFPAAEVLQLLPDSAKGLEDLAGMGSESLAAHLEAWERARSARLAHMTFQLTLTQCEVVDQALVAAGTRSGGGVPGGPNRKAELLYRICLAYLDEKPSKGRGRRR